AKQRIIDEGSDPAFGARPLRRYIQQHIETLLAYKIIEDNITTETTLVLDWDGEQYIVEEKTHNGGLLV
ncbi:MAG: hypothetical protein II414_01180, partial [Erysipelotrichaceae bacterium]|nr:hypothetical protein [Erysipelotrichaceae bacterium]